MQKKWKEWKLGNTIKEYLEAKKKARRADYQAKCKEQCIRNDNGALAVTDEDKKIAWKSYCEELSNTVFFVLFFNCYLAIPQPTLGHSQGDSLTNLMLITAFCTYLTQRSLGASVGSLSLAECLAGFEPGTFQFLLQHLNSLGHSPQFCQFGPFFYFLNLDTPGTP